MNHVTQQENQAVNQRPPTEVREPAVRRDYTAEYKRQIVAEINAAPYGGIGAILRREALYSTTVDAWRKETAGTRTTGVPGRKPSPQTPLKQENERLRRENERLQKKLQQAALIIELQKKVGLLMPSDDLS